MGYLFMVGSCHDPGTFDWKHGRIHTNKLTLKLWGRLFRLETACQKQGEQSLRDFYCLFGILIFVLTGYLSMIGSCHDPGALGWNTWAHSYKEAHLETLG